MTQVANTRGPLGLKADKPTKPRKPMRKVSPKKAAYRRSEVGQEGLEHMAKVKRLPCVICHRPGPSDVHHVICGRFGTQRATSFQVIPLCPECHRYPHPFAIHSGKASWIERNGPDYEYLPVVADMLANEWNPV